MDDEIHRLVVGPFREIVEKGNTAIENSQDASEETKEAMSKSAQTLVKEGERALKRIEPLCTKNYADFGSNFVDAIKENDEIAEYRSELEDLLWDFDDFIEATQFDEAAFDALQKASRKAAPKIMDILKRMKLAAPLSSPRHSAHAVSEGTARSSMAQETSSPTTPAGFLMEDVINMSIRAGPDEGVDGPHNAGDDARSRGSHRSPASEHASEAPPEPPTEDPWKVGQQLPPAANLDTSGESGDPGPPASYSFADSPTIHPQGPGGDLQAPARPRVTEDSIDPLQKDDQRSRTASLSVAGPSDGSRSSDPNSHRWTASSQASVDARSPFSSSAPSRAMSNASETQGWPTGVYGSPTNRSTQDAPFFMSQSPVIPEDGVWTGHSRGGSQSVPLHQSAPTKPIPPIPTGRQPSTESVNSSVFDVVDIEGAPMPSAHGRQNSGMSMSSIPYSTYSQPPAYPGSVGHAPPYQSRSRAQSTASNTLTFRSGTTMMPYPTDLEAVPTQSSMDFSTGLIPVSTESSAHQYSQPPRQPDCSIGPSSSFFKLKGFCKGAEESMRGGPGYKKYKRPVGGFSYATVAKCKDCLFELDYEMAERDLNKHPSAYFTCCDVNFRLRALQKSHLPARNIDEQLYGCVFCIQMGQTMEESDATVFFSQKQLFAHLARHPRPLPQVPGLTVIEAPERPAELDANFDFHFPEPPVLSVMHGIMPEISRLPTGVATETKKTLNGMSAMRGPPDRTPVLQLAIGARVVGIEFPLKYDGKWGIGWHDGIRAAFEADAVRLDPPPKNQIRMQGTSNLQATARWKWAQKGDGQWLKFDKGETIKNIGWSYADHWCWSGTSSKGWGIFPQSHIDQNTVRTSPMSDDAESISSGSGTHSKKSSIFKTGLRRNTDLSLESFLPSMSMSLKGRDSNHNSHNNHFHSPPAPTNAPRYDPEQAQRQNSMSSHYSISHGPEVGRSRTMRAGL